MADAATPQSNPGAALRSRPFSFLLELAFPPNCMACFAGLEAGERPRDAMGLLCADCRAALVPIDLAKICQRCGLPLEGTVPECGGCAEFAGAFSQARAAFRYATPAGAIVRNIKYHRREYLAERLVELAAAPLAEWLAESSQGADVMPVPMHWLREMRRGFNQAEAVAKAVARLLGRPMAPDGAVLRAEQGSAMARLHTRAERVRNLAGAFRLARPEAVRGRRILLVDDVMTTGTTAAAVAALMAKAGAAEVRVFTPVRALLAESAAPEAQAAEE